MLKINRLDWTTNTENLYTILSTDQKEHFSEPLDKAEHYFSLAVYAESTYIGGIVAKKWLNTTHISLLALEKDYRQQGLGTELLKKAEAFALTEGSQLITINTQDYQAKDFYLRFGYEIFGELKDCPFEGTTKYYLVKRL